MLSIHKYKTQYHSDITAELELGYFNNKITVCSVAKFVLEV